MVNGAQQSGFPKEYMPIIAFGFPVALWFVLRRKKNVAAPKETVSLVNANGALYMLDGVNDILEVFAEKVTITPKRNASSILIRGMKGSKTIPFPSITAIQFREANPINGYIQFSILGGLESKGGVIAAIGDENSCFFTDKNNALARQIKDYIETQIFAAKTPGQAAPANLSDELHKLAKLNADGVLTDDEFQSAKKRLIS